MEPPPTNTLYTFQSEALFLVVLERGITNTAYVRVNGCVKIVLTTIYVNVLLLTSVKIVSSFYYRSQKNLLNYQDH